MQPPQKIMPLGRILHNSGEGPIRVPGNRLDQEEQGTFLSVRVFFYSLGLNFDSSDMIYISILYIHQQIKEMMTN